MLLCMTLVALMTMVVGILGQPTYLQQGVKLVGTPTTTAANQGYSVAMSNTNVAIIGGYSINGGIGAAHIFRYDASSSSSWQQQQRLTGGGNEVGQGYFGTSVAISTDGNTAVVGAFGDTNWVGAAFVFIYNQSISLWVQQGAKLVATDYTYGDVGYGSRQGYSVAMSGSGNLIIVGAYADNYQMGGAWIFQRDPATSLWSQIGLKLFGTGGLNTQAQQGVNVAMSKDGLTAVVGGPYDDYTTGAIWVYTAASSSVGAPWAQLGSKLVPVGSVGQSQFGRGLSINMDGTTIAVGAYNDSNYVGASYIFTRDGGNDWTQQGPKLVGSAYAGPYVAMGLCVSLCGDGNTMFMGGDSDNTNTGSVWIFTRNTQLGSWSQAGTKYLPGTGYVPTVPGNNLYFGVSVRPSDDCTKAIIGAHYDNSQVGASWVFSLQGSCDRPADTNLILYSSSPGCTSNTIKNGFSCVGMCVSDYSLSSGTLSSTCNNGIMTAVNGTCTPNPCNNPPPLQGPGETLGTCQTPPFPSGYSCNLDCLGNYTASSGSHGTTTCSFGSWSRSDTSFACNPNCALAPTNVVPNSDPNSCHDNFPSGASCTLACAEGYVQSTSGSLDATCLTSGTWSVITGECMKCDPSICKLTADELGHLAASSQATGLIAFSLFVVLAGFVLSYVIVSRKQRQEEWCLFAVSLSVADVLAVVAVIIDTANRNQNAGGMLDKYITLLVVFLLIPVPFNAAVTIYFMAFRAIQNWYENSRLVAAIIWVLSLAFRCDNLLLTASEMGGINRPPMNTEGYQKFIKSVVKAGIFAAVLEDLPKIVIQIMLGQYLGGNFSTVSQVSIALAFLSVGVAVLRPVVAPTTLFNSLPLREPI